MIIVINKLRLNVQLVGAAREHTPDIYQIAYDDFSSYERTEHTRTFIGSLLVCQTDAPTTRVNRLPVLLIA